jgi:hypothetical protein
LTNFTGQLPKRLVMNVRNTRYDLVRESSEELLNVKFSEKDEDGMDWDILWCDLGITPERLTKMKDYQ